MRLLLCGRQSLGSRPSIRVPNDPLVVASADLRRGDHSGLSRCRRVLPLGRNERAIGDPCIARSGESDGLRVRTRLRDVETAFVKQQVRTSFRPCDKSVRVKTADTATEIARIGRGNFPTRRRVKRVRVFRNLRFTYAIAPRMFLALTAAFRLRVEPAAGAWRTGSSSSTTRPAGAGAAGHFRVRAAGGVVPPRDRRDQRPGRRHHGRPGVLQPQPAAAGGDVHVPAAATGRTSTSSRWTSTAR